MHSHVLDFSFCQKASCLAIMVRASASAHVAACIEVGIGT